MMAQAVFFGVCESHQVVDGGRIYIHLWVEERTAK